MTPREIGGFCTDCGNWTPLHDGRCGCGSGRVAVPPAGYVILPAAEAQAIRDKALEEAAEVADNWGSEVSAEIRALKGAKP